MKHGRISFLTDRGSVLGTSATVVFIPLVSVVPSIVTTTVSRVVGRHRSILPRGGGGREVEIQEFVRMLLLHAVGTLLMLTMLRIATHIEFQNLLMRSCIAMVIF